MEVNRPSPRAKVTCIYQALMVIHLTCDKNLLWSDRVEGTKESYTQ